MESVLEDFGENYVYYNDDLTYLEINQLDNIWTKHLVGFLMSKIESNSINPKSCLELPVKKNNYYPNFESRSERGGKTLGLRGLGKRSN